MEATPLNQYCNTFLPVTLLISIFIRFSIARDTITPTQPLLHGDTLVSSAGSFILGFFTPPNSTNSYVGVWYNNVKEQTVVWVANRNNPVVRSTGTLSITPNGTLTITDDRNATTTIWSTSVSTPLANPVAQLLDSGNFVVKDGSSTESFAWQGFDHPTDTLLPGLKVGVDRPTGFRRNLTSWKADSDPSPGDYTLVIDPTGDPEMVILRGPAKVWRSGPWDGLGYSGVPTTNLHGINFSFVNDGRELSYSYRITNQSLTSRMVMSQSGVLERVVWIEPAEQWEVVWYDPREQCDQINQCGPFSWCDSNDSPVCSCLQGFTPKNPRNWALRDGSDGCVRKTELDCRNGTDGFATVSHAKLPDTANSTVDRSLSIDQCRAKCLRNCSCTGFAVADTRGSGSGCVIWVGQLMDAEHANADGGQDLYVRLAAADLGSSPSQISGHARMAIILSLSSVVLLLSISAFCLWRRKRRGMAPAIYFSNDHSTYAGALLDDDLELPLFNLAAVAAATEDFAFQNKLGEGGFGCVYKGKFGEEKVVAVKRLAKTSIQGIDEFKNEVILIAKLQHRNLVRLLGCCIQGEEMMLIYEYMPNKSLDAYLFDKEKAALLDWQTRYHIIEGIARGLLYLHQDSRFRIIHRDLKASNILLDKDLNPKISDFGLARIFGGDETEVNTGRVVGTYGYMSPEYAMDGIFSMKSDVFSFGVLVLEIISGQRNKAVYSSPEVNLLINTWNLWNEGNGLQIVDESMRNTVPLTEVLKCMKVGLLCVQERPEDRPLMSSVVLMLASDSASLPKPLEPGYLARRGHFKGDLSSRRKDSSNELSITVLGGR